MVLAKQTYKLGKQGILDKEIQETIDRNEEELEQVKQDAADAVQKADDLTHQVTDANAQIGQVDIKLETEVGKINTDIYNLNNHLKAPNIIPNPEPMFTLADYPKTQDSVSDGDWQKMDNRVNNKEILPKDVPTFSAESKTRYTQQIEVMTDGTLDSLTFSFYTTYGGHIPVQAELITLSEGCYIAYASWTATSTTDVRICDIRNIIFTGSYVKFRHPKIEEGEYTPYYVEAKNTVEAIKKVEETTNGFISEVSDMTFFHKENLIGRLEPMPTLNAYPSSVVSVDDNGWAKFSNTLQEQEILPISAIMISVEAEQKYTQQITIETDGNLEDLTFTFYCNNSHNKIPSNIIKQSDNRYIAYSSWTPSSNGSLRCVDIKSLTIEGGSYVKFCHPKVEKGDYTAYTLSDAMNNATAQISKIEQTQDGIKTTVQDNKNNISQMTQTVKGLQSTVQDNTGKISQATQTVEGFDKKVQNIEGQMTQNTQTINGIQSTVSNLDGRVTTNTQTIEGFNRRVETIDGKVSENTQTINGMRDFIGEMQGGRPNLLQDPTNLENTTYWQPKGNGISLSGEVAKITGAWAGVAYKLQTLNNIKSNQQYTLSFDIYISSDAIFDSEPQAQLTFFADSIFETSVIITKISAIQKGKWCRLKVTVNSSGSQPGSGLLRVECNKRCTAGYFETQHFKLEEGTEASGFDQNGGGSFTEVIKDVKGLKTTVSNQQNQITEITQSASGMQATLQQNKEKINQLTLSSQHLQSDIRDLTDNTNSKISQLSNNINMKVSKGDLVAQINLDPSGVLIDGKKVKITGETYIQNGVIKDAMIASLKVDKLTGDKASFIQTGLDGETGSRVQITGSGIKFSGRPYTSDYDNNYVEVNSGHLKFWAGGGTYSDSYGYMGTAKRGRFLTVTAGVVKNGSEYDRSPALALRSSGQDVLVATRQSVALSGGTVYIGNNTSKEDGYSEFYNNVYEATSDGQITDTTTTRVAIGAKSEIWLRCNNSVKVKAGNDFIVDTSSSVFLRPSLDVKLVPGSGVNIQRSTSYDGNKDIRFYYESQFGYGMNAPGLYKRTSSGSANLTITGGYNIMKTSSARKYKTSIKEINNLEEAKKMLEISPISWIDKAEAREKGMKNCDRYVGFLADDFDDVGLTEVVDYDQDGEVESLAYDRLSVYMIQLIKDLYKQIDESKGENKK